MPVHTHKLGPSDHEPDAPLASFRVCYPRPAKHPTASCLAEVELIDRTLSHYRIVERLGAGGMGEVYRARDEKLHRDVALKVLPEGALADKTARGRFRKEAHALSRLSHPHIAHLLDFDTEGGIDFLVMELVTGPSLEEALRPGPLPEKDVLRLGTQLARGLQAAHEQGVVHRDLKPSNLHLTPDGLLKVLDFGLARLLQGEASPPGRTTVTKTVPGAVVGTPPYMAPEQLLGKSLDARTDLYAAGAVLYELATGYRPFGSRSGAALTDAILHQPPPSPRSLSPSLSPGLEAAILKALDKDPELRYQAARELLVDLERLQVRPEAPSSGGGAAEALAAIAPSAPARRPWTRMVAAAVITVLAAAWLLRPEGPPRITDIRPLRLDVGPGFHGEFSPTWTTDGVRLYYVAQTQGRYGLYHVALAGGEPAVIPQPFDYGLEVYGYLRRHSALVLVSKQASFTAAPPPIWLVPIPAGTPRRLGNLAAHVIAVSPDEKRLALTIFESTQSRILIVGLDDPLAPPLAELRLEGRGGYRTVWSPDGMRLRFTAPPPAGHGTEHWVWETSSAADAPRPLWPGGGGSWIADERLFVFERRPPLALRSDIHAVRGNRSLPWAPSSPFQLTRGPVSFTEVGTRPDGGGLLAYGTIPRGELQRFDRRTRRFDRFLGGESVGMVGASPDGEWLAWVTYPERTLWRGRRDGTERLQLTMPPDWAYLPAWSPDGRQIAFVGRDQGDAGGSVRLVSADGGPVEILERAPTGSDFWDPCWLPDGRSLVFSYLDSLTGRGIRRLDLAARTVSSFDGAEDLLYPKCGPQGQLLAMRPAGVGDISRPEALMAYWPQRGVWEEIGPNLAYATWTRDGQSFCGLSTYANRIDCYSFATRRFEPLVEIGDNPLLIWVDVPWMGLDADDNPLVMLDRSTRDLYALDWEVP